MTNKGAEKIVDALTQLMEGYCELQESIERDYGNKDTVDEESAAELSSEVDTALVTEIRAALETLMEEEDFSAEEIASVISVLTDSLEEIDPDVFEQEEETESIVEDDDDDYDDDDYDDDDEDEDDEDDAKEEEE